ncbi:MAG TPA: NUDIX hydrolase [Micromonosporaceae bacterium]
MDALTPVRAAGGVVWRTGRRGREIEVLLVHRPRMDDWTVPKGKLHQREHSLVGAVREVFEETGVRPVVNARLPSVSYPVPLPDGRYRTKVVDYWAMTVGENTGFQPGPEVDALRWLPLPVAMEQLSYPRDHVVLTAFAEVGPLPAPVILIRSVGSDARRARQLARILREFRPDQLICHAGARPSLAPLAVGCGVPIEVVRQLDLDALSSSSVVCGEADAVADLLATVSGVPSRLFQAEPGEGWALFLVDRQIAALDLIS